MKRISKRLLCLALVLSMLVGVIPAVAAASEPVELAVTGASASSVLWSADNLYDDDLTGNNAGSWTTGNTTNTVAWVKLSLSTDNVNQVSKIRLYPRDNNGTITCFPSAFYFQYSMDGIIWNDIPGASYSDQTAEAAWKVYTFEQPVIANYIRMVVTARTAEGKNYYCQLAEIEVYGTTGDENTIFAARDPSLDGQMLPDITVNGMPVETVTGAAYAGEGTEATVAAASTDEWEFVKWTGDVESTENPVTVTHEPGMAMYAEFSYVGAYNVAKNKSVTAPNSYANNTAWHYNNLTDGNYVYTSSGISGWSTGSITKDDCDVSVTIDLGAGITINEAHVYPRTDSLTAGGKPASFPKDFTVSVSSNGSDWETVATVTDAAAPDVGDYFKVSFDKSVEARYVKFNFTATNDTAVDDTVNRIQLCELGVYNTEATLADDAKNALAPLANYQSTLAVTSANKAQVQALVDSAKAAVAAYVAEGGSKEDLNMALLDGAEAALAAKALYQTENYTIELTTTVVEGAQGIAFGMADDTNSFIFLQFSTSEDNARLVPHVRTTAGWDYKATDISQWMGESAALENKTVYERIEVNGTVIKTYLGFTPDEMNLVLTIDLATYSSKHPDPFPLLNIGARHNANETATFDDIVVRDGNGNLIYSEDFENPDQVVITGNSNATAYAFTDGVLCIGETGGPTEQRYIFGKASAFDAGVEVAEARINEIGEVTAESRTAVEGAREAYEVLTDAQKAEVSNYDVLTAAEEALTVAKIGDASYYTVEEAVADADADDIVKLVANSDEEITVAADKTLYLDLNGKSLKQVTVEGNFYGMDTTTDDYVCGEDDYGKIGTIIGEYDEAYRTDVTGKGKRYVAVTEDDGISFHRFYVGITHIALRPGKGGAGYTMTLAGDDKVKSVMSTEAEDQKVYGYTVYLKGNEGSGVTCSGTKEQFTESQQRMTPLTLNNVLSTENEAAVNKENAENYIICVEAFVMLNNEKIVTNTIEMSFKDIVLATDKALNINTLSDTQKAALLYMYEDLGVKAMGWELVNIPKLAENTEAAE